MCAVVSVVLGAVTFKAVNDVSGPSFQPIVAACTDTTSFATMADFVERTGYHSYEPYVGLGVFNFLVCLITQFLLELRTTFPEGLLVWGGIMTVAMTYSVMAGIEGGRSNVKGPIRYPMIIGLFGQLFGISVIVPLIWVPSYIYGGGVGPVPPMRSYLSVIMTIPNIVLAMIVFMANTDDYIWTVSAGILGGPLLVMSGALFWFIPPIIASADDEQVVVPSKEHYEECTKATQTAYRVSAGIAFIGYYFLVYIAYSTYGMNGSKVWNAVWTDANSSVAFMTIDTLVLYLSILSYIAYKDLDAAKKAFLLTPLVGPGAASLVLAELEKEQTYAAPAVHLVDTKKEKSE